MMQASAIHTSASGRGLLACALLIAVSVTGTGEAYARKAVPWVVPASASRAAPAAAERGTADVTAPDAAAEEVAIDPGADPVNSKLARYVVPPRSLVLARVDLSEQTMSVYVDDQLKYVFRVSTGRMGFGTPPGQYTAEWLSPFHRSKKYHFAPMPWSVFFHGGYAVHGTTEVRNLGRPASHGCVRLHPDNAKIFFKLVQGSGIANARVTITQ